MNVGEKVEPGHGLHVTLTSMLPFAEYSVRMMTLTQVSHHTLGWREERGRGRGRGREREGEGEGRRRGRGREGGVHYLY